MICDKCGKDGARIKRVARTYGKGSRMLVIEKVPVVDCPNCGESYLTADTLHEIERIKSHRVKNEVKRTIPLIEYTASQC